MDTHAAPGEVLLGRYRVERVLGQGGMGIVVAARHIELGQLYAIKFLLPTMLEHNEAVERFLREARAAAKLTSDHVVRVSDVGRMGNGAPYMVMDRGNDVDERVRNSHQRAAALAIFGHDGSAVGLEALKFATSHNLDLVLLDLGLPDSNGIEVTRRIREWSQVPVIIISTRGREDDKVTALDSGANDYLTKPFGINELLARMRVALRYTKTAAGAGDVSRMEFGALRIDLVRREVTLDGKEVHLTPIEYKRLVLLAQNAGKVITHQHILREIWGPSYANQAHYVRVHMAELRKKIEMNPARPKGPERDQVRASRF